LILREAQSEPRVRFRSGAGLHRNRSAAPVPDRRRNLFGRLALLEIVHADRRAALRGEQGRRRPDAAAAAGDRCDARPFGTGVERKHVRFKVCVMGTRSRRFQPQSPRTLFMRS
jgi:hypothetical protein